MVIVFTKGNKYEHCSFIFYNKLNMETFEITLVKKTDYKLTPFGRFIIKGVKYSKKHAVGTLPMDDLHIDSYSGMPYTDEQYLFLTQKMREYKTNVFVDGANYYTIFGSKLIRVSHAKFYHYRLFLMDNNLTDSEEAWKLFVDYYKAKK